MILALLFTVLFSIGLIFTHLYSTSVEEQMGERALNVAQSVAKMPAIIDAIQSENPSETIQPIVEDLRAQTGAEFIVVGDKDGIRVAHPIVDRIGKPMVGGDSQRALAGGESYVSKAEGSLGLSLRGKTPIFEDGKVIGIVSVGFLTENIEQKIDQFELKVMSLIGTILLLGLAGGFFIARNVKRSIFGLEPSEIGAIYSERNTILQTVREGIIAVDKKGEITLANQEAHNMLNVNEDESLEGKDILSVLPKTRMPEVLRTGKAEYDKEITIGKNPVIVNRIPIIQNGEITGVVSSFRRKTEIEALSRELSQVQSYANVLRSQTHEYANKLYTILGLIQLGAYDEAIDLIHKEAIGYQEVVQLLVKAVPNPIISALILGKYHRAHELRITFSIDEDSNMSDLPDRLEQEKIVTILGNLIDNAMDAVLEKKEDERMIHLFMTDIGRDLIFEIDDSGNGVHEDEVEQIFERGVSSKKGEDHGIGLSLVKNALDNLGGYVTISTSRYGGAAFTVVIPKEEETNV